MSDSKKDKFKLSDLRRQRSEEIKKQKLGDLETEQTEKDLAEDAERLRKEEEEAKKSPAERALDEALSKSRLQEDRKHKRKKQIKQLGIGGGVLFFIYLIYLLFVPFKGTMDYGACKVFLELHVQYPQHLKLSGAEEWDGRVRIWYRTVDGFGEYRLERIECNFIYDEMRGRIAESIYIDRLQLDPEVVESFNISLPVIYAHPPDLSYPMGLPDALENLKFEIDAFRKPIFTNTPLQ